MFLSVDIEDAIPLLCHACGRDFEETLTYLSKTVSAKYVDKVVPNQGLCITLVNINDVKAMPILGPNDGRPCFKVNFQAIIFKPFPKQIISGRVLSSDATGLRITLNFFQDVRVPAHMLQDPASL